MGSIKLSNHYIELLSISLEPEGVIAELKFNQSLEIVTGEEESPMINIQLRKDTEGLYISIWPEKTGYTIFIDGSKIFP